MDIDNLIIGALLVCQRDEVTKPLLTVAVSWMKRTRMSTIVFSFHWDNEESPGAARSVAIVWLDNLSPPQRPLSCCFDRRLVVRGLGKGKNGSVQSCPLALTLAILFNYFPQKSLRWGEGAERIEMKDQPLPLNFALDLWPCVQFSLGRFLASFGRLSRLRYFALPSLHEG